MERRFLLLLLLVVVGNMALFPVKGVVAVSRAAVQVSKGRDTADEVITAALLASNVPHTTGRHLNQINGVPLGDRYTLIYGPENVITYPPSGTILQYNSNGCRIGSTVSYTGGTFTAIIKTPGGSSSGVVSAFYLASTPPTDTSKYGDPTRDEMDFEWLGNKRDVVQSQFLVNGVGWNLNEVVAPLGFDTAADFHTYTMVWALDRLEWYVDGLLIRQVLSATQPIPTKPMYLYFTLWASRDDVANNPGLIGWVGAYDGASAPYQFNVTSILVPS